MKFWVYTLLVGVSLFLSQNLLGQEEEVEDPRVHKIDVRVRGIIWLTEEGVPTQAFEPVDLRVRGNLSRDHSDMNLRYSLEEPEIILTDFSEEFVKNAEVSIPVETMSLIIEDSVETIATLLGTKKTFAVVDAARCKIDFRSLGDVERPDGEMMEITIEGTFNFVDAGLWNPSARQLRVMSQKVTLQLPDQGKTKIRWGQYTPVNSGGIGQ